VVFIEPTITGIPPLAQASDDHPPANIIRGQEFIEEVYWALRQSPHWEKSLLLITYDEHGGFYDHVPPPGTPLGDPEWLNGFPKIHPDGEVYLGPRVPTFIVSPYVRPGSVSHTIFDHTAVLKSLLVRFRKKLRRNIFGLFGDRVPMMNHLGVALNLSAPELRVATRARRLVRTPDNFGDVPAARPVFSALPRDALIQPEEMPYGFRLARAMMPKPRTVA
jgi:phospholipase C